MAASIGRLTNLFKGTVLAGTKVLTARSKSVSINKELIDFTNDSSNGWRESAAQAATRSVTITLEGLVDLAVDTFRDDALAETQDVYTLQYEDNGELASTFNLTSYEESMNHDGELTYSVTLESSGAVTFTAV